MQEAVFRIFSRSETKRGAGNVFSRFAPFAYVVRKQVNPLNRRAYQYGIFAIAKI